jgi:hypothetical protein
MFPVDIIKVFHVFSMDMHQLCKVLENGCGLIEYTSLFLLESYLFWICGVDT